MDEHTEAEEPLNVEAIADDLITTNEIGDGTRDYRFEDGKLFVDLYSTDSEIRDGVAIPDSTYRIIVNFEKVED